MEPRNVPSSPSPETGAYHAQEAPSALQGEVTQPMPEKLPVGPEAIAEKAPSAAAQATPMMPLPQLPSLPAAQNQMSAQEPPQNTNPMVAADIDLIEKEWVDKAKRLVAQTKDDPYAQEKEVSKLQADYLKKRYGKEIKTSSE